MVVTILAELEVCRVYLLFEISLLNFERFMYQGEFLYSQFVQESFSLPFERLSPLAMTPKPPSYWLEV